MKQTEETYYTITFPAVERPDRKFFKLDGKQEIQHPVYSKWVSSIHWREQLTNEEQSFLIKRCLQLEEMRSAIRKTLMNCDPTTERWEEK